MILRKWFMHSRLDFFCPAEDGANIYLAISSSAAVGAPSLSTALDILGTMSALGALGRWPVPSRWAPLEPKRLQDRNDRTSAAMETRMTRWTRQVTRAAAAGDNGGDGDRSEDTCHRHFCCRKAGGRNHACTRERVRERRQTSKVHV